MSCFSWLLHLCRILYTHQLPKYLCFLTLSSQIDRKQSKVRGFTYFVYSYMLSCPSFRAFLGVRSPNSTFWNTLKKPHNHSQHVLLAGLFSPQLPPTVLYLRPTGSPPWTASVFSASFPMVCWGFWNWCHRRKKQEVELGQATNDHTSWGSGYTGKNEPRGGFFRYMWERLAYIYKCSEADPGNGEGSRVGRTCRPGPTFGMQGGQFASAPSQCDVSPVLSSSLDGIEPFRTKGFISFPPYILNLSPQCW